MREHDPLKLDENKYVILGIYEEKLQLLVKGKIPYFFEMYSRALRDTLPYFSIKERIKYRKVLDAGLSQFEFLRASQSVASLKNGELKRKKIIDSFLSEFD